MRKPDAEGSAKNLNPKTTLREGNNVTPLRRNRHTAGSGIGGRISPESAANPTWISTPDRQAITPGIGNGSAP